MLQAEARPLDRIGKLERRSDAELRLMAQLTDDCFAFNGPLLPVDEAERLIAERIAPVDGCESVALRARYGRVLAGDIVAPVNVPPFDNSAVDGFAVRADGSVTDGETRLAIVDRVAAGHVADHAIEAGEAIRIFTGAPMPQGADTVFMQEDCRVEGDAVVVPSGLKRGANRRFAGEDMRAGAVALPAGRRLSVQHRCARGGARPYQARPAPPRARRDVLDR